MKLYLMAMALWLAAGAGFVGVHQWLRAPAITIVKAKALPVLVEGPTEVRP